MNRGFRIALLATLLCVVVASAACGGGNDENSTGDQADATTEEESTPSESPSASASAEASASPSVAADPSCEPVEQIPETGGHYSNPNKVLTAEDFSSNPPATGKHKIATLQVGQVYREPVDLGEAVHSLEHGAVIYWMNALPEESLSDLEEASNALFDEGYTALIVAENPDMDVPFAMSAWGYLQRCTGVDPVAMGEFTATYYGSGPEGFLACVGRATKLFACKKG